MVLAVAYWCARKRGVMHKFFLGLLPPVMLLGVGCGLIVIEDLGTAALILATVTDSKVNLVAGVTKDSTDRIKAGDLVNFVAEQVGGRGGGRPDMAQAGGNDPAALAGALEKVPDWVRTQLSA